MTSTSPSLQAHDILSHGCIRCPIYCLGINARTLQVVLERHPGGWHLTRNRNAAASQIRELELSLRRPAHENEGIACHNLAKTDEGAIRIAVVVKHDAHRPAPRHIASAIEQCLGRFARCRRQLGIDRKPELFPITIDNGKVERHIGRRSKVLVKCNRVCHRCWTSRPITACQLPTAYPVRPLQASQAPLDS